MLCIFFYGIKEVTYYFDKRSKNRRKNRMIWYFLFYHFILYSFFGWIYESCYVSFKSRMLVNRGFLTGPYIPIYGFGATVIYLTLYPVRNQLLLVFFGGMLVATILELVTSYLMEKLFHAKWWDYSAFPCNFQGRICLGVSLFWGILSVIMMAFLEPITMEWIHCLPVKWGIPLCVVLFVTFFVDCCITTISTLQLSEKLNKLQQFREEFLDFMASTKLYGTKEELRKKWEGLRIAEVLERGKEKLEFEYWKKWKKKYQMETEKKQRHIHKRLLKAFPNLTAVRKEAERETQKESMRKKRRGRKGKNERDNKTKD